MKKAVKVAEKDRLVQIAAGDKKMNGEIKRMAGIPPKAIKRNVLKCQNKQFGTVMSVLSEKTLKRKKALQAYYAPFFGESRP